MPAAEGSEGGKLAEQAGLGLLDLSRPYGWVKNEVYLPRMAPSKTTSICHTHAVHLSGFCHLLARLTWTKAPPLVLHLCAAVAA